MARQSNNRPGIRFFDDDGSLLGSTRSRLRQAVRGSTGPALSPRNTTGEVRTVPHAFVEDDESDGRSAAVRSDSIGSNLGRRMANLTVSAEIPADGLGALGDLLTGLNLNSPNPWTRNGSGNGGSGSLGGVRVAVEPSGANVSQGNGGNGSQDRGRSGRRQSSHSTSVGSLSLRDLGDSSEGGSPPNVASMPGYHAIHGYPKCCKSESDDDDENNWVDRLYRGKWISPLSIFFFGTCLLIAAAFQHASINSLLKDRGGALTRLRAPLEPLLTISPPSAVASTTAEQLRNLPWQALHRDNLVFFRQARSVLDSALPQFWKAELRYYLSLTHSEAQTALDQYSAFYNEYTTFIYIITTDLTSQIEQIENDIDSPDTLLEPLETGHWVKKMTNEPVYAEKTVDQYQDYWYEKRSQKDYIKPNLTSIWTNYPMYKYCDHINATVSNILFSTMQNLTRNIYTTISYRDLIRNKYLLQSILSGIEKPCKSASDLDELTKAYERDVDRLVQRCIDEGEAIMTYVMPWRKYWGRDDEAKKKIYSVKILELVRVSASRALGLMLEIGGSKTPDEE